MDSISLQEVRARFGEAVDDDVISECAKFCKMYNITVESLYYTWEALNLGRGSRSVPVIDKQGLSSLQRQLQNKAEQETKKRNAASNALNNSRSGMNMMRGVMRSGGNSDPFFGARIKQEPVADRLVGSSRVGGRAVPAAAKSAVSFSLDGPSSSDRKYRYMYEKVSERSEVLDDRIEDMAQLIKEHYDIAEFGDPSATTEEDVVVVGRITLDGDSSSSGPVKLNEASLTLETSRAMGSGVRVPFKFEANAKIRGGKRGAGGVGLFPGAIVALRGNNGGGGWFTVSEVLSLPTPKYQIKRDEQTASSPFTVCVACGPFTTDSGLEYKPMKALLAKLKEEKPDVVLLVGPFIDASHPHIKHGDIDAPPETMFRSIFVEQLQEYLDSKEGSLAIVVPNVRDILSDHTVFPQAQLNESLSNDPRIKYVPNPSRFRLNGVSFAVSSVDVLFHIRKEEFFKRAPPAEPEGDAADSNVVSDPMANTCRHLLEQRSYYPVFPVPQDLSSEINLDVTHSDYLNLCNEAADGAPDVFVTPSRLKQFTKNVDGTTFVNPSYLTKGTYASLKFDPSSPSSVVHAEVSRLA
ncbi:DNA-directed DNA polymerase alpha subunit pol12 [Steccherinum ochraceum]|uniref:DNA polymerase alpha subunit B n=1 Tax=Steccherinum ochraceum TaxID=92696 RepID=A0A4R0R4N6_9APHY|nr:DNA-directed DNA polymerase alpha subunit pol12 [Steccherinum ochraceum]